MECLRHFNLCPTRPTAMQRLPTATIRCICRLHHSAVVPSACCGSVPRHRTAEKLFVRLFARLVVMVVMVVVVVGLSWRGPLEPLWDVWSLSCSAGQAGGVLVTSNLRPLDSIPLWHSCCGLLRAVQTSFVQSPCHRSGDLLQDIPKELITYQRESHMFSPEYNKYERVGKGKTPYHGRFDMYPSNLSQICSDLWRIQSAKALFPLPLLSDGHLLSFVHNCWTQEVPVSIRSGSKMDELPGHSWSPRIPQLWSSLFGA